MPSFFFMLPALIAFVCTECFFYFPYFQRSIRILFLNDCITAYLEFRNIWNAWQTRPDLEPKSDTLTLCQSAFPRFTIFSFGLMIEKHSTVCPKIEVDFFVFFLTHIWKIPRGLGQPRNKSLWCLIGDSSPQNPFERSEAWKGLRSKKWLQLPYVDLPPFWVSWLTCSSTPSSVISTASSTLPLLESVPAGMGFNGTFQPLCWSHM